MRKVTVDLITLPKHLHEMRPPFEVWTVSELCEIMDPKEVLVLFPTYSHSIMAAQAVGMPEDLQLSDDIDGAHLRIFLAT